jgi:Heavy metal associated domain 2
MATTFFLTIVHTVPGRTRLRVHPTPLAVDTAEAIASRLVDQPGITDVEVNRLTGSIRCLHRDDRSATDLLEVVMATLPGAVALGPGQAPPPAEPPQGRSAVARSVAQAFRAVNQQVLTATNGSLDLGTIAAIGFAGTGAVEVMVKGNLPAPPWFNLAWWAFRTFITFEKSDAAAPEDRFQTAKAPPPGRVGGAW